MRCREFTLDLLNDGGQIRLIDINPELQLYQWHWRGNRADAGRLALGLPKSNKFGRGVE
jgi:hypothetical protein